MPTTTRQGKSRFLESRPRAVEIDPASLFHQGHLPDRDGAAPLVFTPVLDEVEPCGWFAAQAGRLQECLRQYGAVLFRRVPFATPRDFETGVRAFGQDLMDYLDQHTPRTRVGGDVYTSTEYPADQHINFHSENSKNHIWPMTLWFYCVQPADVGGETPIADNRQVLARMSAGTRRAFEDKGVMYVRNFGHRVGLRWQQAFQTDDPQAVERYCREAGVELEWRDDGRLRTRHVTPALTRHPRTGEPVWFNQAHLFHVAGLDAATRESLLEIFPEHELPSHAYFGDGSQIAADMIAEIRGAFDEVAISFPWQPGDLLMLDNVFMAHGRRPYRGSRRILVAMAGACTHAGPANVTHLEPSRP